jgi:hypothetical protein
MVDPSVGTTMKGAANRVCGGITPVTRRFGTSNIGFENQAEAERD